ncbi:MAG: KH domain-containing protein, partial [Terriglobales bacterium]
PPDRFRLGGSHARRQALAYSARNSRSYECAGPIRFQNKTPIFIDGAKDADTLRRSDNVANAYCWPAMAISRIRLFCPCRRDARNPQEEALMGTEQGGNMQVLVEKIAKALVDDPEQVVVHSVAGEQLTVLELSVASNDLGKVIGKQGRTARCIRTILGAASMKLKKRYTLEILE